jgi:hypothetical protein
MPTDILGIAFPWLPKTYSKVNEFNRDGSQRQLEYHHAVMPPSTVNMPPVAKEASSEASHSTIEAISSGSPIRAMGALASSAALKETGSGTVASMRS